jgi:hypothetical protein
MKIKITLITLPIIVGFVACGEGGGSTTSTPEDKKSTLNQTEQNISFTKYDDGYYKVGQERKYERENDVVTDLVTGLAWQDTNETGDGEIIFDWAEAQSYCSELTLNSHSDWRLPTIHELKSLVVYSKKYPAMTEALENNIKTFEESFNDSYWSSTLDASNSTMAWIVGSFYGQDGFYPIFNWAKVRCVRGKESMTSVYKREESLGIIMDTTTNLVWQDDYSENNNSIKKAFYSDALNYCESLILAQKDDWRLPNINELYSLIDKTRTYPSIDPSFKKVVASEYWSSTTDIKYPDNQWTVNFAFGMDGTWVTAEKDDVFVRCVRGGR